MTDEKTPQTTYLKNYRTPDWLVDFVDITFDLYETHAFVHTRLNLRQNPVSKLVPVILFGEDLELMSLEFSGTPIPFKSDQYQITFSAPAKEFTLDIITRLKPQENTRLEGLYRSKGMFCTQCEAEGFRRITYYPDRPDVMARFRTTIQAEQARYPVLLSNGNRISSRTLPNKRHEVVWDDPFPKPSYLFALVAGNLYSTEDNYITSKNRKVQLSIYVEKDNLDKTFHAMASLKQAMRWDEERFGLEYDLDTYMIVAVNDFNMGAMENKGLNIFNSKYILASDKTATDQDYENIQGVIGHEYFHNWTGNRVTCRDWFQLSLKEGLTVFRDQEFTSDLNSRPVKRIQDVKLLRTAQFAEDAGPMSHPVRPESYIEISNFYTLTIYEKGAEIIRMLHTLLGEKTFQEGMKCYFSRHDGQAVTTDDFVAAMEQASGRNLKQFKLWYSQAGTPEIHVRAEHDPDQKTYTLFFRQHTPPTPGQPSKQALLIPFALALLDKKGQELPLTIQGEPTETGPASPKSKLVEITKEQQSITFLNIKEEPVPSLLRNFSAPVKLSFDFTDNMLAFLSQHDTDPFNRWEAGQNLALKFLAILVKEHQQDLPFTSPEKILTLFRSILADPDLDDAFKALSLTLPNEQYLAEQFNRIDVEAIHAAHLFLTQFLAQSLQDQWIRTYQARKNDQPNRDGQSIGRRSLKNLSLHYLSHLEEATCTAVIQEQFYGSQCMTDEISALICLERKGGDLREQGLEHFYNRWSNQPLIIDKWFTIQATSNHPEAFNQVQKLVAHPDFTLSNPNRVRSLLGAFSHSNLSGFHQKEGQVYNFFACIICDLDSRNPQLASRLAQAFSKWRKFDEQRGGHMKAALENILKKTDLSKDTYEIVEKSLS